MTLNLTDRAPQIWGEHLPLWFQAAARIASLFLMATGIVYWADMLGLFGTSGLIRGPWQDAGARVVLSCAFLIASVGVWQLTFWGVVMWVLSTMTQTASILMVDDFSPFETLLSFCHFLALLMLAAVCGWVYFKAARKRE